MVKKLKTPDLTKPNPNPLVKNIAVSKIIINLLRTKIHLNNAMIYHIVSKYINMS